MSTPDGGDKPLHTEYTGSSKKKRPAQHPLRDIGVERFRRPGGTLVDEGHVRQGSAFEMLGRKKTDLEKRAREKFDVARDEGDEKTRAGRKANLDGKTGVKDKTNGPTDAPNTGRDTTAEANAVTGLDETQKQKQKQKQDKSINALQQQESGQEDSKRVLQTLRPNVVRPTPAHRVIKAKPGAWGTRMLMKPAKHIVTTPAYPVANKADSTAREVPAVKNKPDGKGPQGTALQHNKKSVVKTTKRQVPVDSPSPPQKLSPRKNKKRRKVSSAPLFSSGEEDDLEKDELDNAPIVRRHDRRRAQHVSPPCVHDSPNQSAASPLLVDDQDEDEEEDDREDTPVVQPNRRRRAGAALPLQIRDSPEQAPVPSPSSSVIDAANTLMEIRAAPSVEIGDDDEDQDDLEATPIVQPTRRRRAKPATPPCQFSDSPDQTSAPSQPLSDNAAVDRLLQLGAPPSGQAPGVSSSSIPTARFPTAVTAITSRFTPINTPQRQARSQSQSQPPPEPKPQAPPQKVIPHPREPPGPKKKKMIFEDQPVAGLPRAAVPAKPKTTRRATAAPRKKPAPKPKKTAAATAAAADPDAPEKRGAAAIAGKKGQATKPMVKNKKRAGFFVEEVDDDSGSEE